MTSQGFKIIPNVSIKASVPMTDLYRIRCNIVVTKDTWTYSRQKYKYTLFPDRNSHEGLIVTRDVWPRACDIYGNEELCFTDTGSA